MRQALKRRLRGSPSGLGAETPPSITLKEAAHVFASLSSSAGVLIAVSGGADSLALLRLMALWGQVSNVPLFCATVDHGLRAESTVEAEHVAAVAQDLGVPHHILHWKGLKPVSGIEQAARAARYCLLTEHAHALGCSHLVTAHTLDDQAETLLLRLAAGSGLTGLAGIRPDGQLKGITLVRPLLTIPKARLVAVLHEAGITWCQDAMNADPTYARPRLRAAREALEHEGLTADRLAVLARRLARADAALESEAKRAFARVFSLGKGLVEAGAAEFGVLDDEIGLRVLGMCIAYFQPSYHYPRLEKLERAFGFLQDALQASRPAAFTLMGVKGELRCRKSGAVIRFMPAPARKMR